MKHFRKLLPRKITSALVGLLLLGGAGGAMLAAPQAHAAIQPVPYGCSCTICITKYGIGICCTCPF